MKKLFAVLLSIALVLSMGTMALAVEGDKAGAITIEGAITGATYSAYKMLDFTPSDNTGTKGIYKIVKGWEDFFNKDAVAADYFTVVDNNGQVTVVLKKDVTEVSQELAKAALNYAVDKGIVAAGSVDVPESEDATTDATIEDLDLGYYVVDTTVGTMTALKKANNTEKIVEKNEMPRIDKFVQEDSEMNNDDKGWGKVNDADIDQVVNYKSTITVGLGAVNYIMHDTMEAGLTFDPASVRVELQTIVDGETVTSDVDADNYTVIENPGESDTHKGNHTFDVKFDNDFIKDLKKGDKLVVYYSATLNDGATVGPENGNDNEVYLTVGENSEWETAKDKTSTFTWLIDVLKYVSENEDTKTPLEGAKFQLLDPNVPSEQNKYGTPITLTKIADTVIGQDDEGNDIVVPTYKRDAQGTVTVIETDDTGKFIIEGLDEGRYLLEETEAPAGYNKLSAPIEVVITSTYDDAALKADYTNVEDKEPATIEVENKTGGLFPETGGIGTVIFYVVGGLLMLAAVVFLVSKKRMATFA